jgi:hypothetical protein
MQHLDDALIAEWVDGAIAEDSPRHGAIAAHVGQCDECRIRVEEERALAGHVRQLLGVATPPDHTPPFEEVLYRAGSAPKRAPVRSIPVAWRRLAVAATVVVAGGVGWYARGLVMGRSAVPAGAAVTADAVEPTGGTGTTGEIGMADARDAQAAPPLASTAGKRLEVATTEAAGREAAVAEERSAAVGDNARREAVAERQVVDEIVAARRDAAPPAAPAVAQSSPMAQAVAPAENELRMQKAAAEPWGTTTRLAAERALGRSLLLVPELRVVSIEMTADSGMVRVRQDLGGGGVLELVQSRAIEGVASELAAGALVADAEPRARMAQAPEAIETIVVSGMRVVVRAPVTADSMRVLIGKFRT